MSNKITVSAAQLSPVYPLNKEKTGEKTREYINQAAKKGADLIVFPECFLPGYPNWSIDLENPNDWVNNLKKLIKNSVSVDSPEIKKICEAAQNNSIFVVLGINERQKPYDGTIYNSIIYISPEGEILHVHRKLFPTNREKSFHKRGEGNTLKVIDSSLARISGLICYEHLQPLLKYALMSQGEQIHCALWPGWPNFAQGRDNKQIIATASRQYAIEAQNFVILSSTYVDPEAAEKASFDNASWSFFGGSAIINPMGEYVAEPVYDREELIIREIDLDLIIKRKAVVDTTGKDSRWNKINLNIKAEAESPIEYGDDNSPENALDADKNDESCKGDKSSNSSVESNE